VQALGTRLMGTQALEMATVAGHWTRKLLFLPRLARKKRLVRLHVS